jgi:hypothetical protein
MKRSLPFAIYLVQVALSLDATHAQTIKAELGVSGVTLRMVGTFIEISGECRNLTDSPFRQPIAKVSFTDIPGRVLATGSASIEPHPLKAGELGKFTIRVEVMRQAPRSKGQIPDPGFVDARNTVNDYALSFEDGAVPLLWQSEKTRVDRLKELRQGSKIELSVAQASINQIAGIMQVSGRVTNVSDKELRDLTVKVDWVGIGPAFLGAGILPVGTCAAGIEPASLKPGETGTFMIRDSPDPRARDFRLNFMTGSTPLLWQYGQSHVPLRKRR